MSRELVSLKLQLNQMKKRFRTLMEAIPVGILILGDNRLVENANPHALALFKSGYANLTDKPITELFFGPKDNDFWHDDLFLIGTPEPIEVIAQRPDGETFPAEILLKPFIDDNVPKVLVSVEDVTKRHELERMKQQFVTMITHDLRDPLTALQIFLTMATEGIFDDQPVNLKKRAATTEKEVDRLIKMINSLLDVEKIESGRLEMQFDTVTLQDVLETSISAVAALAEERKIDINVRGEPDGIYIRADLDYIVQALVNLLGNALKFSPCGEPIDISLERSGSFVKIMVTDHGPGIPEELRQRLFNRFEQARISDPRIKGGSGLGLAIAKSIIGQHGGSIGVDSKKAAGSTFWFTVPLMHSQRD